MSDPNRGVDGDTSSSTDVTRRDLAKMAAGGAAVLGVGGVLAACGSSSSSSSSSKTSAGNPQRGGTLRCGFTGGGTTDTIDGLNGVTNMDFARIPQLYDPLVGFDKDAKPTLVLAEEVTATKNDGTEWVIRLKPDLTFHNGKPVTADDLIYMFKRILDPKAPAIGALLLGPIDTKQLKKDDERTVRVGCKSPFSTFFETLANYFFHPVPTDYDPKKPVGVGPFKYESFTPGQESVFTRNENYWQTGKPYLDRVVITDLADESAQINALRGGQVDVIDTLSSAAINTLKSVATVSIAEGGVWNPFVMNTKVKPFDDIRVLQAFKLMVDREQMLNTVFSGHGTIANDLYSPFDPVFDKDLPPRPHDPEQAKALLKQAGYEGLSVQLVASELGPGMLKEAQILAQQAKAAGVNIKIRQVTPGEIYGPNYQKWQFTQDVWFYASYFPNVELASLPGGAFNATQFDDKQFVALHDEAIKTLDEGKRAEIAHEMQKLQYNRNGYIIPFFSPSIDAYGKNVHGIKQSKLGSPLGYFNFRDVWLS